MTAAQPRPIIEPFVHPSETRVPLEWAPLITIDLATFDEPGSKEKLAEKLENALTTWGFWVITGTGLHAEEIDRQLAIGNAFFKQSINEKRKVACDFAVGNYFVYREPMRFLGSSDVKENVEMLNIPKYTSNYASMPRHDLINQFEDEIAPFQPKVWKEIICKLFILFAVILELPEDYFINQHQFESPSEDHLRYMYYHPRSPEDDGKVDNLWTAGHTDFGSLTLVFMQRIAALQVRTPDSEWKWIKPMEGGIVCNAGDTLSFLTKGYIKSAIHRVVRPPADQAHLERLGYFYFARPCDNIPMVPAPSPLLLRKGLLAKEDLDVDPQSVVTGIEYVRARVKDVHGRMRIAENDPTTVFRVKNLAIQDIYT